MIDTRELTLAALPYFAAATLAAVLAYHVQRLLFFRRVALRYIRRETALQARDRRFAAIRHQKVTHQRLTSACILFNQAVTHVDRIPNTTADALAVLPSLVTAKALDAVDALLLSDHVGALAVHDGALTTTKTFDQLAIYPADRYPPAPIRVARAFISSAS